MLSEATARDAAYADAWCDLGEPQSRAQKLSGITAISAVMYGCSTSQCDSLAAQRHDYADAFRQLRQARLHMSCCGIPFGDAEVTMTKSVPSG